MYFTMVLFALLSEHEPPVFKGDHDFVVAPLDFSDETNPKTFFHGLNQIESDGKRIYVSDNATTHVLIIDKNGSFLAAIGEGGEGPEGLGRGVFSIAVEDGYFWVSDWQRKALHFYDLEKHLARFEIPHTRQMTVTANPFAFSLKTGELVFQANPRTRHMGSVFDFDGNHLRDIGELPPISRELFLAHPYVHQTMWVRGGTRWYALFKSFPTLVVFDHNFEEINRFHLEGPEITYYQERFQEHLENHDNRPGNNGFKTPQPFFTDFKWFQGKLYTLSHGTLYQIYPETGAVFSRTRFRTSEGPTTFFFVTFLNDQTIILGHPAMIRDHDLWKVNDVPFL